MLAVGLRRGLADGTYTATYRVISADGHPVSGGILFSIGHAGGAPARGVAQLIDTERPGRVTEVAFGVVRGVDHLATALAIGILAFLIAVWLPALRAVAGAQARWQLASEAAARRARQLLGVAVVLGIASGLAGIVLQGAIAAGESAWSALEPAAVREVLGTRFGVVWGVRVLDWALIGVAVSTLAVRGGVPALRPAALGASGLALGRARLAVLVVPVALLAVAPALAGHASTQSPVIVLFPADVLHVSAMSVWLGGLIALLAVVVAATRRLEGPERTRTLAAVLVRFSPIALTAVVVLAITGVLQAYVDVRHLHALTPTAFGRSVLIKIGLLCALIGLGALNRRRHVPALQRIAADEQTPGAAGVALRRTLRAEVAVIIAVLAITSALVSYAPPIALSKGPVSRTTTLGPLQLQITLDPATSGANDLHLYLFQARTGAQFQGTRELTVKASLPAKGIGGLPVRMRKAGPGHYVSDGLTLLPAGTWRLRITDRVSDVDEYVKAIEVPVR